jgi:uncharacterized delta-60 repeat protein
LAPVARTVVAAVLCFLTSPAPSAAAIMGDLDYGFGSDGVGVVLFPLVATFDELRDVAIRADGKIVAVGRADLGNDAVGVIRLNADGSIDDTFGGGDGVVTTVVGTGNARANGVIVQSDDKIVVVGRATTGVGTDVMVVRYLPDGALDATFGTGGKVLTDVAGGSDTDNGIAVVEQSDGKLVVAGNGFPGGVSQLHLLRYLPDGTLDTTFGTDGIVQEPVGAAYATSVALLPGGKILAGGQCAIGGCAVRYDDDGTVDTSFGPTADGISAFGRAQDDLVVQADGKLVGVSTFGSAGGGLSRWNADGTIDASFGTGGFTYEYPDGDGLGAQNQYSIVSQADGKVVINTQRFVPVIDDFGDHLSARAAALVRFNADGTLDDSFGPFGDHVSMGAVPLLFGDDYVSSERYNALTTDADGRVVAVGIGVMREIGNGFPQHYLIARYDVAGCGGVAKAALQVNKLLAPAGDESVKLMGTVTVATTPVIDPATNGFRIIFGDLAGGTYLDVSIPPGTGWKSDGTPGTKWSYKNKLGFQGITQVGIKPDKGISGRFKVQVQGKNGDFTALAEGLNGDLVATVIFDVAAVTPTQCSSAQWPDYPLALQACVEKSGGKSLKCK